MYKCEVCEKIMEWSFEKGYHCPEHPFHSVCSNTTKNELKESTISDITKVK